jgi:hypothetical protein
VTFADGTGGSGNQSPGAFPGGASGLPSSFSAAGAPGIPGADSGLAGTADEQQVIAALVARNDTNAHPSAITTLLAGPVLRGMKVSQS